MPASGSASNGATPTTTYHRMLDQEDQDAVYVIMPPQYSLPIIVNCLDAGKHVLVEKPPAMSVADMETLVEAAERNDRVTAVCFQRRVAPVAQEVRRLILERGPITMCIGEFHKNMLKSKGPSLGVSTLLDDVIHAVDFVRYMCGGEATGIIWNRGLVQQANPDRRPRAPGAGHADRGHRQSLRPGWGSGGTTGLLPGSPDDQHPPRSARAGWRASSRPRLPALTDAVRETALLTSEGPGNGPVFAYETRDRAPARGAGRPPDARARGRCGGVGAE